ncbi:MAG TPA: bifunctional metallophosphatase/5'-nucleotidase [Bryobacteraceae bacterium]|nr:bifunctional metallophosphatase/5'-nucleotidase [Bryobacteraceae bacterium]
MKNSPFLLFAATAAFLLAASGLHSLLRAAPAPKHVRFLHIADMHAQLDTHWEYLPEDPQHLHRMGGFSRIRTALDRERASATGAVFTLDGGDTFQGSAVAAWTQGEAVVGPLNALGIDAGTPGNWEVVYGPDRFRKLMSEVNYKVICYNFHDKATGKRLFAPSAILEKDGVRVAFVGATDPTTTTRQPPAEVAGLDSTRMNGLREFVQDLKRKEKPDLIVLLDHTGLAPSVQLAHDIPELDIVLSGHTHERVYKPILVGKTIVVEPGSMGSFMGELDVTLTDRSVSDYNYKLIGIDETQFAENQNVKSLVEAAERPFQARLREVVGATKTTLMRYDVLETTMDNFVDDAVREVTHTDIAFTNGFRFSPPLAPGPITEADLWNILPLDAKIKAGRVSGKQLHAYLENEMELVYAKDPLKLSGGWGVRPSGMRILFTAGAPAGSRIKDVKINGKEMEPDGMYTIGGCEQEGEVLDRICRLPGVSDAHYLPGTVHDALHAYLKAHSPIDPKREGRVRATDLPETVWSQYGTLQTLWHIPGDAAGVAIPERPKVAK